MKAPPLRFKEFTTPWEEKKLGEITDIFDGTHQTPNYIAEGVPFYSVEHVTANNFKDTKYISEIVFQKEVQRVKIEKGDILLTRIGDIGTSRLVDWDVRASFYVSLALIKCRKNSIFSAFLNQFIAGDFFQNELWKKTIHVAFPKKINLGEIGNCLCSLPTLPEQEKIAEFLSAVDKKIEVLEKKVTLLKDFKKGAMQQVFSQKLRFYQPDGSPFTDWQEKKLGDVYKVSMGSSPNSNNYSENTNETVLIQGNADIKNYKVIPRIYTSEITKLCNKNDIIMTVRAPVGDLAIVDFQACLGRGVCAISANKFLFYLLMFYQMQNIWMRFSQGSTIDAVNRDDIISLIITLPSLPEQQKIAEFLSSLDEKMEATEAQLNQVRLFKKSLLQKMFI